jgi:hypothetical protein
MKVRNPFVHLAVMAIVLTAFSSQLRAQSSPATPKSLAAGGQKADQNPGQKSDQKLDPRRDINGTWIGVRGTREFRNFASYDQKVPEPPLTDWAKQHLLYKAISHDPLDGKPLPAKFRAGHLCPDNQDPCYSEDQNGVPANVPEGEYPAKDCEPLSTPAIYDYPGLGSMELVTTPDGTRINQMFAYHREWRTWWLNREHPKDLDPTYEGDSTAHWEGNVLVVDTIGYNGKTMISQGIGHRKSDEFRLVERFILTDRDHLEIDMTYYDPKAWGDKSWPGFKKLYQRTKPEDFEEFICSPREYMEYDKRVTDQAIGKDAK